MDNDELISKLDRSVFLLRTVSEEIDAKKNKSFAFLGIDGFIQEADDFICKAINTLSTLEEDVSEI